MSCFLLGQDILLGVEGWHHPLYIGGGDYWHKRAGLVISNPSARSFDGTPIAIEVGKETGKIDIEGADAQALRVVGPAGKEVLFNLLDPSGEPFPSGPVPAGSTLIIPVECAAWGSARYWVYSDNPAAWSVPDFLKPPGLLNGSLEEGEGGSPSWWNHDGGDADHQAEWAGENPHSGEKCLKLRVSPGAANSWISTRQSAISVDAGRTYTLSGWVRSEGTSPGSLVGWYLHVATPQNPMAINQGLSAGSGTYGWKKVTLTFTTPADASDAEVGTMLWGTGTAWFDDVSLESVGPDPPGALRVETAGPETLELTRLGTAPPWFDDDPSDDVGWDFRVPLDFLNVGNQSLSVKSSVNLRRYSYRTDLNPGSYRVVDGTSEVGATFTGGELLFDAVVPPQSRRTYYLYFSRDPRIASGASETGDPENDPGNRVSNPGFETGTNGQPSGWTFQGATPNTVRGRASPGRFGNFAATFTVPHAEAGTNSWPGWRQNVPVVPLGTYRFSAWVKLEDVRGTVWAHAHLRDASGNLVGPSPYLAIGPGLTGTTGWTELSGVFTMPAGCTNFQIHLSMNATGTLSHDGVSLVGNVGSPVQGPIEARAESGEIEIWSVPPVVKVFQDDHPPADVQLPRFLAAGGESEPVQLAVRSVHSHKGVSIEVDLPQHPSGHRLEDLEVGVVGYVPVAHTSDYYDVTGRKSWERLVLTGAPRSDGIMPSDFGGGSDGWVGWWPDPLIPAAQFDLEPGRTQPFWVTVHVPRGQPPGDYSGRVRLAAEEGKLTEIPFAVHVWDFDLPEESHLGAIYDVRTGSRYQVPGQSPEVAREKLLQVMGEHRVGPDHVLPEPAFSYQGGIVSADYTEFDQAAAALLENGRIPRVYMPSVFYSFGWANPPAPFAGENPYPGVFPYPSADRAQLRAEYRRAYQTVLRDFWNHLAEKGWQDRFVLYISDEPHYGSDGIIEQMKALCRMVHEVDPAIPIYSSVWDYVPAWDGFLDVWGIGQFGTVPNARMRALREKGDRLWFTTDGQMCIDTPYCAIERLLPHLAFKYDVEAYEFWGIDWLSGYDPYRFGWHSPVVHVFNPADPTSDVVYPNGDGYLVYPGAPVGSDRAVPTIRLAQAREGLEDFELLRLLKQKTEAARALGADVGYAEEAGDRLDSLVAIPGPSGRHSTQLLPEPEALYSAREAAGAAVERLVHRLQNPPGMPPPDAVPFMVFPQFVNGAALSGALRNPVGSLSGPSRSRIVLQNNSPRADFGKLLFRDSEGVPTAVSIHGQSGEVFDFRLEPWGTLDVQTDGIGALQTGTVSVHSNRTEPSAMEGTLVYEVFGEYVSVPASGPGCFSRYFVARDGTDRTALGLFNPDPQVSANLHLVLREGGEIVARREMELPPLHQLTAFLDEAPLFGGYMEGHPADFKGLVEITSDCSATGFAALGLIQTRADGALISVASERVSEDGRLIFPQFVNGEIEVPGTGKEKLANRTKLVLLNIGGESDSGTIRFKTPTGAPAFVTVGGISSESWRYTVPGNDCFELATDGTGNFQSGVIQVESDRGGSAKPAGSALLDLLGHAVSVAASPGGRVIHGFVSVGAEEDTGIALYNPAPGTVVEVRVALLNRDGIPVAQSAFGLAGGEQLARFVDEAPLFNDYFQSRPGPFTGAVSIEVTGDAAVWVTSFLQKRHTGALITMPVASLVAGLN